jgi:2-keto-4-pentenoate hydratase/2-oxohepta-3-ene-1,7-dioic acid hydratase in catechol pathway
MNTVAFNGSRIAPSKIVCVGRNYTDHIEELGNAAPEQMVLFAKPNSAITDRLASFQDESLHYEGEICFICRNKAFAGVAFGLDLTKRALQDQLKNKGLPWERCKAFDGSALFSDFVPIADITCQISITLEINGAIIQDSDTSHMLYSPSAILAEIQGAMSLCDGDIVMTGTPGGVGAIKEGARYKGSIAQSGTVLSSMTWTAE